MNVSFLLFLLFFPALSLACKCLLPTVDLALSNAASIFRGKVIRELNLPTDLQQRAFIVSVKRIFKGCLLNSPGRIIVTTGSSSASCGIDLLVDNNYVFSGDAERLGTNVYLQPYLKQFSNQTFIQPAGSCSFNKVWPTVTAKERDQLNNYSNVCARKCASGIECPKNAYCDSGKCVPYGQPCPDGTLPTPCFADPCTLKPCVENATCIPNYCGGCTAIFIDANRTRVCV
jgi:hypothetical protein